MKIWKMKFDVNKYNIWSFTDRTDLVDKCNSFDGRKKINSWKTIKMSRLDSSGAKGANAMGTDFAMPMVDSKVVKNIDNFTNSSVELLPIILDEDGYDTSDFYILNVIGRLDCIDFEKSDYKAFSNGEGILKFNKIVFRENVVRGKHIFKAENDRFRTNYISDELRQKIENSNLKGFLFELVWDSEDKKAVEEFKENERLESEKRANAYKTMKNGMIKVWSEDEWIMAIMTWIWGKIGENSGDVFSTIQELPRPCQYIFSMYSLKSEIENGGYNQFFYNFNTEIAKVAENGFMEIGLKEFSLITADAIETYEDMRARNKRSEDDIEDFMSTYDINPLDASTGYFMSSFDLDKLEENSIGYIKDNMECFGD